MTFKISYMPEISLGTEKIKNTPLCPQVTESKKDDISDGNRHIPLANFITALVGKTSSTGKVIQFALGIDMPVSSNRP